MTTRAPGLAARTPQAAAPTVARRTATSAVLLALALALHGAESMLVPPLPVPGARLGLANAVTLLVLWRWGGPAAAGFSACRVVASTLSSGRFLAPGFWMAVAGAAVSLAAMAAAAPWARQRAGGVVPLSILGGIGHNLGQLVAARLLVGHPGVATFVPALVGLGMLAGLLTGEVARHALAWVPWLATGTEGMGPQPPHPTTPTKATGGLAASVALLAALALAFPLTSGAVALPSGSSAAATVVRVDVAGSETLEVPLGTDGLYPVQAGSVRMVIEVRGGRVRVAESTCPHRLCALLGWISRPGQAIVCVPGRAVIHVEPAGDPGPLSLDPEGPDAVSY